MSVRMRDISGKNATVWLCLLFILMLMPASRGLAQGKDKAVETEKHEEVTAAKEEKDSAKAEKAAEKEEEDAVREEKTGANTEKANSNTEQVTEKSEAKAEKTVENAEGKDGAQEKKDPKEETPQEQVSLREFRIQEHGKLLLDAPVNWRDELKEKTEQEPLSIHFTPQEGADFSIKIGLLWNEEDPAFNSLGRIELEVEESGKRLLPMAKESDYRLKMLQGESNEGYYLSLTVADPAPGEWKYMTQGGISVGDLLLVFKIGTNLEGSGITNRCLIMLENATQIPESEISPELQKEASMPIQKDEYHYNPIGKRDPFYSKLIWEEKKPITATPQKRLVGVQRYEIAELKLVGIIWGDLGRRAVVETPEGKSYLVNVGTPIGRQDGSVKAITNQEVVIQEFSTDYLGNRVEKITLLKIERKKEEYEE